jgi:hypothetical protein
MTTESFLVWFPQRTTSQRARMPRSSWRDTRKAPRKEYTVEEDLETAASCKTRRSPNNTLASPLPSPRRPARCTHHFFRSCSGVAGDFFHVCQISTPSQEFSFLTMGHGVRAALVPPCSHARRLRAYATASRFLLELNRGISKSKHTVCPSSSQRVIWSSMRLARDAPCQRRTSLASLGRGAHTGMRNLFRARGEVRSGPWHLCGRRVSRFSCELRAGDMVVLLRRVVEVKGPIRNSSTRRIAPLRASTVDLDAGELCKQLSRKFSSLPEPMSLRMMSA